MYINRLISVLAGLVGYAKALVFYSRGLGVVQTYVSLYSVVIEVLLVKRMSVNYSVTSYCNVPVPLGLLTPNISTLQPGHFRDRPIGWGSLSGVPRLRNFMEQNSMPLIDHVIPNITRF